MLGSHCRGAACALLLLLLSASPAPAQSSASAPLKAVHSEGMKTIAEAQIISLTGLTTGAPVEKKDLQSGADRLLQTGLLSKVSYSFQTLSDGVRVTYHVEEAPRITTYFDNIPWYGDSELGDAIRQKIPFFDGTLPEAGAVVEQVGDVLREFLAAHGLAVTVEHQVLASPLSDGSLQQFRIEGAGLQIARVEFSDPALAESRVVQQHLSEIRGKPYSRSSIDVFLAEQIRPIYQQQGFLRAKLGPAEVRLTGNPNQKLPDQIPVFVPITPGPLYHLKETTWRGNSLLSSFTLAGLLDLKPGDIANGMTIEGGWDRIREEYAHNGYLDASIEVVPSYDDAARTVSYAATIQEGQQYHYSAMVLTGLSLAAERKIHDTWPMKSGDIFDKTQFEKYLISLQIHREAIFKDLPVHYEEVGHWLQNDPKKATVDVLLDFK
jgi:outer membrane protein insertion porin family